MDEEGRGARGLIPSASGAEKEDADADADPGCTFAMAACLVWHI